MTTRCKKGKGNKHNGKKIWKYNSNSSGCNSWHDHYNFFLNEMFWKDKHHGFVCAIRWTIYFAKGEGIFLVMSKQGVLEVMGSFNYRFQLFSPLIPQTTLATLLASMTIKTS
jgi:hypothetical protein